VKRLLAAALFSAAVLCAASADRPRVTRAEVANVEKLINTQLASMFPDEPWLLLGYTRGFYVEGTGVVFSAEINLATGPTVSPFSQPPTKEIVFAHHAKKVQRVPKLRETMYSVLKSLGTFFPSMPPDEQLILAVTILRYPWENAEGLPNQVVMHVPRAKLSEALARSTALNTLVKAEEY
jgi:hypothetical protein